MTEHGREAGAELHRELGYPMLATFLRVGGEGSRSLQASLRIPRAWEGDELGGVYRLRIQGQPGVRRAAVTVVIRLPEGMQVTETNLPMDVAGNTATWRGALNREVDLVVEFAKPEDGLWERMWKLVSRPLIPL